MQDNTGTLTIQTALTRIGRKRLSQDRFKVSKFAVSDDGVNYGLYNNNLPEADLLIARSPLFSVWKDGASSLRSKIPVETFSEEYCSSLVGYSYPLNMVAPFNPNPNAPSDQVNVVQNPRLVTTHRTKNVLYNISNSLNAKETITTEFVIPSTGTPYPNGSGANYISVTLHDTRYFDLGVTPEYISRITESAYTNFNNRNDSSSLSVNSRNNNSLPKTVNLGYEIDGSQTDARFVLFYKGNFPYKNVGIAKYETVVTIMCEHTGVSEDIRITLTPTTSLNS